MIARLKIPCFFCAKKTGKSMCVYFTKKMTLKREYTSVDIFT